MKESSSRKALTCSGCDRTSNGCDRTGSDHITVDLVAKRKPHSVLEINLRLFLTPFQRVTAKTSGPICSQPKELCQTPARGKGRDAARQPQGAHCPLGHFPFTTELLHVWAGQLCSRWCHLCCLNPFRAQLPATTPGQ